MNKVHRNGRPSLPTTLAAGLALAMAFTLSACGGDGGGDEAPSSSSSGNGSPSSSSSGGGSPSSSSQPSPKCGSVEYKPAEEFCDERDEKLYKYVDIDGQFWMAENLNHKVAGSKCGSVLSGSGTLSADAAACDKYGRLYDWATAMNIAASCNTSTIANCGATVFPKHQGVCPSGWHLPSNAEWNVLMKFANPSCSDNAHCAGAGTKLKAENGWNTGSGYIPGTDDHGFSALPGGYGDSGGSFSNAGGSGFWWSSSENNGSSAYSRYMDYDGEIAYWSSSDKGFLFSVRCLQD